MEQRWFLALWRLSTGSLVPQSEQQFEDCDSTCSGCNGGLVDYAFAFAEHSIVTLHCGHPSRWSGRIHGRVQRQQASNDVGGGVATRVHRHRGRPVLFSVLFVWRTHRVVWHETRPRSPCSGVTELTPTPTTGKGIGQRVFPGSQVWVPRRAMNRIHPKLHVPSRPRVQL